MITKKNLMVAVLCTFCLTAALLGAIPVESAGTYDPWIDTNHDGRINVLDLIKVASGIGTSGNPGLNVTVTNPILDVVILNSTDLNVAWPNSTDQHIWWNAPVDNAGIVSNYYSAKGFAHLNVVAACISPGGDTITVEVRALLFSSDHISSTAVVVYTGTLTTSQTKLAFSIQVPSEWFYIYAYGSSTTKRGLYLSYYLTWA
jgi:hypothetical protein